MAAGAADDANARRGRRWSAHRMVINGIMSGPGPAARGVTCMGSTGTGRPPVTGSAAGRWTGYGRRSWAGCGPGAMRPRAGSGRSAPIPPWSGRTSTPPGPAVPCPRSWSRGAPPNDKNRPPGRAGRRWAAPAAGCPPRFTWPPTAGAARSPGSSPRSARRLPAVHPAHPSRPHRPARERTAPHPARPGDGR
jgi:hypothetical protein